MYYVVMDLEWNNAYNKAVKGFFNEIIEIGAVMLDENMDVVDTFSVLIRSQLSKKLSGRVKDLTHITNEDMCAGVGFDRALSDFRKWLSGRECVFMSWGNTDLRVMLENLICFCDIDYIPFIEYYADAQKYCQNHLNLDTSQQIGLSAAAELLGIDVSEFSTHRALDDSLLTWKCLRKSFDESEIGGYISKCDRSFYKRLMFKAKNITDLSDERIDRSKMVCPCSQCRNYMKRISNWRVVNQAFRATFYCKTCKRKSTLSIRYREYFDRIDIKKRVIDFDSNQTASSDEKETVNEEQS